MTDDRGGGTSDAMLSSRRCGAKTRSGAPCRAPAVRGKNRCRMHGRRAGRGRAPRQQECADAWPVHARGHRGTSPTAGLAAAIAQADATNRISRPSREMVAVWLGRWRPLRRFTVDRFIKGLAEARGVEPQGAVAECVEIR